MKWMFLPFKRYAQFSGRSQRTEYWMWMLFTWLVSLILILPLLISFGSVFVPLFEEMMSEGVEYPEAEVAALLSDALHPVLFFSTIGLVSLFSLATLVPNLALLYRRFHDCNISNGWFWGLLIACFVPFLFGLPSFAMFIIAGFIPGTPGPNQFGPNPRPNATPAPPLFAVPTDTLAPNSPAPSDATATTPARPWPKN